MAEITDYELTGAEASLLTALTQGAGEDAAALFGARPIRRVQRWAVARFKPQTAETTIEVPDDPGTLDERAIAALTELGEPIDDPNAVMDGSVWGIVPSGTWNMSPALVLDLNRSVHHP